MKVKKYIWSAAAVLVLYVFYILCTGVFPYGRQKAVSEDFASSISAGNFYGDSPCTDRAALVESPTEGFETRLHILDGAKERVDVSYYAMHMGESTDLFLGALLDAADRGVKVRVLVDGQFGGLTGTKRSYAEAIGAHPNIELKLYNQPNLLRPWTFNGRLHDKYIIVDDELLLLGGRNIGDKYFAMGSYEKPLSYDRDVLVYNTAGAEADSVLFDVRDYMDALWYGEEVREPFSADSKRGAEKRRELTTRYARFQEENPGLFDHSGDDYQGWTFSANRVSFFHNDTQIGVKEPKAGYILGQLLRSAEKSVSMQSPYVILDPELETLLNDLGAMGIEAELLTNSVAASPNPLASTAYFGDRRTILDSGVRLIEYQGEHSLHAKTYIIDERLSVVGSYNLDPRSAYIDTELMLAIDSEGFAARLKQTQDEYRRQSLEVDGSGEYSSDSSVLPRPMPLVKKIMIYALYFPVKLFKYLT